MMDLLIDLILMGLVLLAIYGVGRALRLVLPRTFWGRSAELAFSLALGLGVLMTLLFGLSLVGLLRAASGWALLGGGVALACWQFRTLIEDLRALWTTISTVFASSWFAKLAMLIALAFLLMNLVADLAPPTEGDTVHQYLLVPRYWVQAGGYTQPTHIWAATLPGNMMMLSAWAILLRDSFSLATLVTGFGMSLFLALAVYALARQYFGQGVAMLAAIAIYTMPDAGYLAQSAKVDMGWAFFEALALAAFFRWLDLSPWAVPYRSDEHAPKPWPGRWLILAGVCLGLAAGSKNQTLISFGLLGLWIVLQQVFRGDWRELLRAGLAFGLTTVIAALPYYLYNGIVHHNPFYPVFADPFEAWFGGTPSPRSELGTEVFYPWTLGGYLTNAWNMSLGHTQPGFYLGFIAGPIFLLAIPVGLVLGLLRGERTVWRTLGYAFIFSIVWFVVKQAARHFLPGLILLAAVTGLVLWRVAQGRRWLNRVVLVMALLILGWNFVNGLGILYWSGSYRVALGLESREAYLQRWHDEVIIPTFPDWETINVLNERLGPSDRVLSNHATSPLYIEPQLVPGNWGDRGSYDAITDSGVLLDMLSKHHIHYVLVYTDPSSQAKPYTQAAFLSTYGELIYDGPRTQLYELVFPESE